MEIFKADNKKSIINETSKSLSSISFEKQLEYLKKNGLPQGLSVFNCQICKKEFKTKYLLTSHLLATHEGEKCYWNLKCTICFAELTSLPRITRHIFQYHRNKLDNIIFENNNAYNCNLCEANFDKKSTYMEHTRLIHESKRFKCDTCDALFKQKSGLTNHIKVVHEKR